jgi:hypothetical protein
MIYHQIDLLAITYILIPDVTGAFCTRCNEREFICGGPIMSTKKYKPEQIVNPSLTSAAIH